MPAPASIVDARDEDLMLAYAAGDAAAFDTLYARHRGGLYRIAHNRLVDHWRATGQVELVAADASDSDDDDDPLGAMPGARNDEPEVRASARGDEKIGVDVVLRVLEAPLRQIAANCGLNGSVIAEELAGKPAGTGYDGYTGKNVDMFKAGIIDPLKVVRTALQNAASIAGLMLMTETMVTDFNKDDKKKHQVEGSIR